VGQVLELIGTETSLRVCMTCCRLWGSAPTLGIGIKNVAKMASRPVPSVLLRTCLLAGLPDVTGKSVPSASA
jgi:hypothetical protein